MILAPLFQVVERVVGIEWCCLSVQEDGVHLTRESQYIVGTALAQQHIAIIAGSVSPAVPWECVPDAG